MGSVYAACDRRSGERVAIKLLATADANLRHRLDREAIVLGGLDHPAIVRYVDHGHTRGDNYLVMEWIAGETLAERLAQARLGAADSVRMALRVAEALDYAHGRGIVHRDIKPSNLMFTEDDPGSVKVIDFGVARQLEEARRLTATGALVGTPGYMAPEQVQPQRGVDGRADLFALGCVLYECLAGSRAFTGADVAEVWMKIVLADPPRLRTLRADLPPSLEDLVERMMAKRPEDRPASADEVRRALDGLGPVPEAPPALVPAQRVPEVEATFAETVIVGKPLPRAACLVLAMLMLDGTVDVTIDLPRLEHLARTHGARFEVLADGSIALLFTDPGVAPDLPGRAARCALELQAMLPDALISIVSSPRFEQAEGVSLASLIGRGLAVLRGEASQLADQTGPAICVDDATARLLGPAFDIRPSRAGHHRLR
jgi:hypothetical protein